MMEFFVLLLGQGWGLLDDGGVNGDLVGLGEELE